MFETRLKLTTYLEKLVFDQASNVKFYKLLWTRLIEEGIDPNDAILIAGVVEYDFSNVPEDNDSLSEFATEYASYAAKIYRNIKNLNAIDDIAPLLRYFKVEKLQIASL